MTELIWIIPLTVLLSRISWDGYGLLRDIIIDIYIEYRQETIE